MQHNPYIGPRPYGRGEGNFFGREREGKELAWLILAERAALFYAQSGAGKTSLLNARVIPILEQKGVQVLPVARVGSALPEGVAPEHVANIFTFSALLTLSADANLPPETFLNHTLLSYMQTVLSSQLSALSLQPTTADTHSSIPDHSSSFADSPILPFAHSPILLIFDQFEEIATTHREHWEHAEGFFRQVREAIDTLPGLGVLFVLREDYVAELDPYTPLLPSHLQARFRMTLPTRPQAMQIVMGPAERAGVPFAEEAAQNLVMNLSRIKGRQIERGDRESGGEGAVGQYVEPVQAQVVCQQLWESLPESVSDDGVITWDEIKHYNVDDALTSFYENMLHQTCQVSENLTGLQPVTERRLRRWFSEALITPEGRRGLALQGATETAGLPNAVVRALENYHLIRAETRGGSRWYELSHDRLVEPIAQSNRAWEAAQDQAQPWRAMARQWYATRSKTLLYRGKELQAAQAWLDAVPSDEVEPYEREFIQESQQAARARARARARDVVTVAALVILVIVLSVQPVRRQLLKWRAQRWGELVLIKESMAHLGDDEVNRGYALPAGEYPVPAFFIERYEVTNEQYLLCVAAGVCSPPNAASAQYAAPGRGRYPVTAVTALQAHQFCAWIDRRLPTLWEWERAARPKGYRWPWGNSDPTDAIQAVFKYAETQSYAQPQQVGVTTGVSEEGVYDLAGNVWEWTCTPYTAMALNSPSEPQACVDIVQQFPLDLVIRGGGASDTLEAIEYTMAYYQGWPTAMPDDYIHIGFRCAKSP